MPLSSVPAWIASIASILSMLSSAAFRRRAKRLPHVERLKDALLAHALVVVFPGRFGPGVPSAECLPPLRGADFIDAAFGYLDRSHPDSDAQRATAIESFATRHLSSGDDVHVFFRRYIDAARAAEAEAELF
jgi:hypothetical protein